jgi:hypothetical protein
MVPRSDAVYHTDVIEFALTFNGYSYYPRNLHEIALSAAQRFRETGKLPMTLNRLRACLFFQQRYWRNAGSDPDEGSMKFVRAILRAVEKKVAEQSA